MSSRRATRIRVFESRPKAIGFETALDVARAYVQSGAPDRAWEIIRERLPQSAGAFPSQVAPIILLVDDELRRVMTRERCALVLATPRGP